jgi:hypothetical protein
VIGVGFGFKAEERWSAEVHKSAVVSEQALGGGCPRSLREALSEKPSPRRHGVEQNALSERTQVIGAEGVWARWLEERLAAESGRFEGLDRKFKQ